MADPLAQLLKELLDRLVALEDTVKTLQQVAPPSLHLTINPPQGGSSLEYESWALASKALIREAKEGRNDPSTG